MNKDIRATDKEPLLAEQSGPAGSGGGNQPADNDLDTQPNNCRKYFDRFVKNLTILVVMVAYVVFLGALGYTGWQMYQHYQQKRVWFIKNYEGSKDRMLVHQMAQFYFNDKFFYNMHSFVSRTKHIKQTVHEVGDAFGNLQKLSGLASTVVKARSEIPVGLKIQVLNKEPENQNKQSALKRVLVGEVGKAIKINVETKAKSPEVKPLEAKPAESKPAESKPAETKPAETKPAQNKPSEAKRNEAKPTEVKPAETKPADSHPANSEHTESKPVDGKPSFVKANEESSTTSEEKPKPVPAPDYPKLYREFCDQMNEKEPEIEKLNTLVTDGQDMLTKISSLVSGLTGFTENLLSTRKTLDQQINQYLFDNELTSIYTMTDQDVWLLGWLLYSKKMVEDWQIKPRDMIGSARNYEKLNMTDFLIVKDYLDDLVAQVHKKVISNDHSLADFGFNIARGLFFNITSLSNITNCTNGKLVCPCAEGQTSKPEAYCQEKPKPLVNKKVVNLTDPDAPEPEPPEEQEPVKVDESSVDVITPYTALKSLEKNYFEEPDLRSFGVAFKFIMGRYYSKELGGVPPVKK